MTNMFLDAISFANLNKVDSEVVIMEVEEASSVVMEEVVALVAMEAAAAVEVEEMAAAEVVVPSTCESDKARKECGTIDDDSIPRLQG